jgi:hypothetical protein
MGHCEFAAPAFEQVAANAPAVVGQWADEVLPPMYPMPAAFTATAIPLVLQAPLPQPPITPPPMSEE